MFQRKSQQGRLKEELCTTDQTRGQPHTKQHPFFCKQDNTRTVWRKAAATSNPPTFGEQAELSELVARVFQLGLEVVQFNDLPVASKISVLGKLVEAEQKRVEAEQKRVEAEQKRVEAEQKRQEEQQKRQEAEQKRQEEQQKLEEEQQETRNVRTVMGTRRGVSNTHHFNTTKRSNQAAAAASEQSQSGMTRERQRKSH